MNLSTAGQLALASQGQAGGQVFWSPETVLANLLPFVGVALVIAAISLAFRWKKLTIVDVIVYIVIFALILTIPALNVIFTPQNTREVITAIFPVLD